VPPLSLANEYRELDQDTAAKESSIREFLDKHGILTIPDWIQHYMLRPMPGIYARARRLLAKRMTSRRPRG